MQWHINASVSCGKGVTAPCVISLPEVISCLVRLRCFFSRLKLLAIQSIDWPPTSGRALRHCMIGVLPYFLSLFVMFVNWTVAGVGHTHALSSFILTRIWLKITTSLFVCAKVVPKIVHSQFCPKTVRKMAGAILNALQSRKCETPFLR
jgi:hypothetical protein